MLGFQTPPPDEDPDNWVEVYLKDLKQDALTSEQIGYINAVPNKADKAVPSAAGNLASLTETGNLEDSGAKVSDFATQSDLPYRLVEPGKWEFSGLPSGDTVVDFYFDTEWFLFLSSDTSHPLTTGGTADDLTVSFLSPSSVIIATRASLPGDLLNHVVNAVEVTGATTLTLPAAITGYARDFYVRLTVSAAGAGSAVTWTIAQGETWDATGAPPSSFAAGTYLYRVTEVAPGVWHAEDMFAVAGKMPMYPMVAVTPTNGTLTVAPYTVATYTADTSAAAFEVAVGTGETGTARDCELVIDCTATGAVAPTVTWPATFHPRTDAATDFACEAGVRNVYYISEYATGEFAVGGWQETAGGNGT